MSRLSIWVAALWWASLSVIGFLVVPLLFAHSPTPAAAGVIAAKLFSAQTWVSTGCGLFLLLQTRADRPFTNVVRLRQALLFVVAGMLLALLAEFVVAPHIVARDNLRLWHSIGSLMYLLQLACAALIFWRLTPPSRQDQV